MIQKVKEDNALREANSQKKDDSSPTKIEVSIANVDEFISYLKKNNVKVVDDWVIENIIRSFKFKIKTKVIP